MSARVCLIVMEFYIPTAHSLKEKRMLMRRLKDRLRARFNVAVAEVGEPDLWQRATLAAVLVARDEAFLRRQADKVILAVEDAAPGELTDISVDIS